MAGPAAWSGVRLNGGLGASGTQVIEGFDGVAYEKPMQRIKETIEICRATWRREVIDHHGKTIDIPLPAGEGSGLRNVSARLRPISGPPDHLKLPSGPGKGTCVSVGIPEIARPWRVIA